MFDNDRLSSGNLIPKFGLLLDDIIDAVLLLLFVLSSTLFQSLFHVCAFLSAFSGYLWNLRMYGSVTKLDLPAMA